MNSDTPFFLRKNERIRTLKKISEIFVNVFKALICIPGAIRKKNINMLLKISSILVFKIRDVVQCY